MFVLTANTYISILPIMLFVLLQLIFKKSKQSNILSPVQSEEIVEDGYNRFLADHETSNPPTQKEGLKQELVKTSL